MAVPCVVLVALGVRIIAQQEELAEKRAADCRQPGSGRSRFLHADGAIEKSGNTFVISGRRPLAIDLQTPVARSAIEPTVLTAPGEPGAITQGHQERRGTQLVLETAPADRAHINVRLRLSR